jgi:hypothetical protein
VWVFFTEAEPPKKQHHYVNDPSLVTYLTGSSDDPPPDSGVYLVSMDFSMSEGSDGVLSFDVTFEDENDVPISWTFETTGPPSAEYAGELIDQIGHDLEGGILVMYISESALSSDATVLEIGDDRYPVGTWDELSQPPYFTAYHGVCTRGLSHGYLAAGEISYRTLSAPEAIEPGAAWQMQYQIGTDEPTAFDWPVETRSKDAFTARNGSYVLTAKTQNGELEITEIRYEADGGYLSVRFDPALPDLQRLAADDPREVAFAIDIDDHLDQITGTATVTRDGRVRDILLAPESPDWAVANQMHVEIDSSKSEYTVKAETIQQ